MTKKEEQIKQEEIRRASLLEAIAELGGKGAKEEDIVYQGTKLVLPTKFSGNLEAAIDFLTEKQAEEEEISNFHRTYKYRPFDGAFNAYNGMKKAFGMVKGNTTYSFFGPNPPSYISVQVGPNTEVEVPWGQFTIPLLEKTKFNFGVEQDKEFGAVFRISVSSPRKNRHVIMGLFNLIDLELKENSIYRGGAFDGQETPKFLDLSGFDESKVVYSENVRADLNAHLWGVIQYSAENRKFGLPLKRAILLHGPYGTGKSLAGWKTGTVAVENGWTFIMARPGRDDFTQVMQTARLYQPAVVFMEDVEQVAAADSGEDISMLLDLFDGIDAKNNDLMVVLTTNHPDNLHKGMMRPGRLDAIVEISHLDGAGIEKLIRVVIGDDRLDDKIDFKPIVEACEGYLPAFIREAANRAVRYAIVRNRGQFGDDKITTEDLVYSAQGLRDQFERMNDSKETSEKDRMSMVFSGLVKKAVAELADEEEVWDVDQVEAARAGK